MKGELPEYLRSPVLALRAWTWTWTWRHSLWACFAGAANFFCNGTPLANTELQADELRGLCYNVLQFGFPLVWLVGTADRLVDAGQIPDALAYLGAVALTVLLGVWCIGPALAIVLGAESWWSEAADLVLAGTSFGWLLLGTGLYAQRRGQLRASALLEAQERQHAERQRELAAAQLLALQARVDPELLFERLRRIDTELQDAPALAQRRLDALIELLRTLRPHQDQRLSTLGREFDAAALLDQVLGHEVLGPERLHLHLPQALRAQAIAPAVLLPLLRGLLGCTGTVWSVRAETGPEGRLLVRLEAQGPDDPSTLPAAQALPLTDLCARLRAVLGEAARLELHPAPMPCLELSWPAS